MAVRTSSCCVMFSYSYLASWLLYTHEPGVGLRNMPEHGVTCTRREKFDWPNEVQAYQLPGIGSSDTRWKKCRERHDGETINLDIMIVAHTWPIGRR